MTRRDRILVLFLLICSGIVTYSFAMDAIAINEVGTNEKGLESMESLDGLSSMLFMPIPEFILASGKVETTITAASNAYVITGDEMKMRGYRTFRDIINDLPGTVLYETEGDNEASPVARGNLKNSKFRIMVNGQSISLKDGFPTVMHYNIPIDGVDRVEYIIGPYASMYGRNVYAGIVNIITKRGKDINGGGVALLNGNGDRKSVSAYAGYKLGGFDIYMSAFNDTSRRGYDLRSEYPNYYSDSARRVFPEPGIYGSDPTALDEYYLPHNNKDYLISLKHDSGLSLDLEYNEVNSSKTGTNYPANQYQSNDKTIAKIKLYDATLGYNLKITDKLESDTVFSFSNYRYSGQNRYTYGRTGYTASEYFTIWGKIFTSYMLEQKLRYAISDTNNLFAGISYEKNSIGINKKGIMEYPKWDDSELLKPYYVTYMLEDDIKLSEFLRMIVGFTFEKSDSHDNILIPRASLIWSMNEINTLKLLYGGGFKTPDSTYFNDQIYTSNSVKGRTDLAPEKITSYELQYIFNLSKKFKFDTSIFLNVENDAILEDIPINIPPYTFTYENSNQERKAYGFEANITSMLNDWMKIFASYGFVDGESVQTDLQVHGYLSGTVKQHYKVGMNMLLFENKFNLYVHNLWKGPWVESLTTNFDENNGYSVVDICISTTPKFNESWSVSLGVTNLFNVKAYDGPVYDDVLFYTPCPVKRRMMTAKLSCKF